MTERSAAFLFFVLVSNLLQAQDFLPGRYYDRKGERVDGYILNPPIYYKAPPIILFKTKLSDPNPEEIKIGKMKGFVAGADTFAILRQFKAEGVVNPYLDVIAGVVQVLQTGKVNLYKYTFREAPAYSESPFVSTAGSLEGGTWYTTTNYILQQAGKDNAFAARMDQREFNRQMSDYLKMNPSLSDSLRAGAYSNKNTPEVIRKFNTWYKQRKPAGTTAKP
jgi:hypothetical protein